MKVRKAVAKNKATDLSTRAKLMKDSELRKLVVRTGYLNTAAERAAKVRPFLGSGELEVLAHDPEHAVRLAAALQVTRYSGEALNTLLSDPSPEISNIVLSVASQRGDVLERMANSDDQRVLSRIWDNSSTPPELKRALTERLDYSGDDPLAFRIATFANTGEKTLGQLALHSAERVRLAVAKNEATTTSILQVLARDSSPEVRAQAIASGKLPLSEVELLSNDPDPRVLAEVAGDPRVSESILALLALGGSKEVQLRTVGNSSTRPEVLARLARSYKADQKREASDAVTLETIQAIVRNPNVDPGTLAFLARFEELAVALAGTAAMPPEGIEQVVNHLFARRRKLTISRRRQDRDMDSELREIENALKRIVRNSGTPLETLRQLGEVNWMAPRYTKRHVHAPMDEGGSYTETVLDSSAMRDAWAAELKTLLPNLRQREWDIINDDEGKQAFVVLPEIPESILDVLIDDPNSRIRARLAANTTLPLRYFERLLKDNETEVRESAARAERWFGAETSVIEPILGALSRDVSVDVRKALLENRSVPLSSVAKGIFESSIHENDNSLTVQVLKRYLGEWRYSELESSLQELLAADRRLLKESPSIEDYRRNGGDRFRSEQEALNKELHYRRSTDRRSQLPLGALEYLADNGDDYAWELLLRNAKTPDEIVARILGRVSARSSEVFEHALSRVRSSKDGGGQVALSLAKHEAISPDMLATLATMTDQDEVLRSIAENPQCPESVLVEFATSARPHAVQAAMLSLRPGIADLVAGNPSAPSNALKELSLRRISEIDKILLQNPNLPESIFLELMRRS